jgi:hypothetical protein
MEEVNGKKRSRKWVICVASFCVVSAFAGFGVFVLAKDAGDIALIIGAWGGTDALLLKLYNDANLASARFGGGQ